MTSPEEEAKIEMQNLRDLVATTSKPRPPLEKDMPRPEPAPNLYSISRIRTGINYANSRIQSKQRKPSPKAEKQLRSYVNRCETYLKNHGKLDKKTKHKNLTEIHEMEQYFVSSNWAKWMNDGKWQAFQDSLLALRKMEYHARYGDWNARMTGELRSTAKGISSVLHDSYLSSGVRWSKVSAAIYQEDKYLETDIEHTPVKNSVGTVCRRLGLNPSQAFMAIHKYSERNNIFHSNDLTEAIEDGHWSVIANLLFADLEDLPNVMHVEDKKHEEDMRANIEYFRDSWFTKHCPVDPNTWTPKPALLEKSKHFRAQKQRRSNCGTSKKARSKEKPSAQAEEDRVVEGMLRVNLRQVGGEWDGRETGKGEAWGN